MVAFHTKKCRPPQPPPPPSSQPTHPRGPGPSQAQACLHGQHNVILRRHRPPPHRNRRRSRAEELLPSPKKKSFFFFWDVEWTTTRSPRRPPHVALACLALPTRVCAHGDGKGRARGSGDSVGCPSLAGETHDRGFKVVARARSPLKETSKGHTRSPLPPPHTHNPTPQTHTTLVQQGEDQDNAAAASLVDARHPSNRPSLAATNHKLGAQVDHPASISCSTRRCSDQRKKRTRCGRGDRTSKWTRTCSICRRRRWMKTATAWPAAAAGEVSSAGRRSATSPIPKPAGG